MATTVSMANIMANDGKEWFPATRGNCSWQLSPLTPGDGAGSSIKIIPSGAGEATLTSAAHALVASHKYYITFKVMYESAANCTFDWYWPVAEPSAAAGMRVNAAANTWHRVSAVFGRTSFSDGSYPCRFDYNNDSGANITIWFTSCMLVDLTAAFGAGLEPSKEWLDKHITAFSDAPTVQYVDNLSELFKGIADAIRAKSGQTGEIMACDFADRIRAL
nr:MAG TPA: hypothetical protein [Caudoviricetes sp.]